MKNKKGFTLIELLAVIVILSVIMVIATNLVNKSIEESRKKVKYIAAKEITDIASVYIETKYLDEDIKCIKIQELINNEYLDDNITNPKTGENGNIDINQAVCKDINSTLQENYDIIDGNKYLFDGYIYYLNLELK